MVGWLGGGLIGWLARWQAGRLAGWQAGWQAGGQAWCQWLPREEEGGGGREGGRASEYVGSWSEVHASACAVQVRVRVHVCVHMQESMQARSHMLSEVCMSVLCD